MRPRRRASAAVTGSTELGGRVANSKQNETRPSRPPTSLRAYTPLNTLKPVAAGIWIVDGPLIHLAALGLRVPFTTRMTVVQLRDGGLWCHSPIAPDAALFRRAR